MWPSLLLLLLFLLGFLGLVAFRTGYPLFTSKSELGQDGS
jgi:hypothetical protein